MTFDSAASTLLAPGQVVQDEADEDDDVYECSQPACPAYDELLGVMSRAAVMSPIEETLASYLSIVEVSALKTPSLSTQPLRLTSRLNGRAYAPAGQAEAAPHIMAVLQTYQVDLSATTLKSFMSRWSRSIPQATKRAGFSQSEDLKRDQKASTDSCVPPPLADRTRRRREFRKGQGNIREVVQNKHTEHRTGVSRG